MKWYWIVLIVIGAAALGYLVWMNIPKKVTVTTNGTGTGGGAGGPHGGDPLPS